MSDDDDISADDQSETPFEEPTPSNQEPEFYLLSSVMLLVYFVVWLAGLSWWFQPPLLILAFITSATYCAMHFYENHWRHHSFLSADSTAFPVTGVVFVGVGYVLVKMGLLPAAWILPAAWGFCLAFVGGHLAVLLSTLGLLGIGKLLSR